MSQEMTFCGESSTIFYCDMNTTDPIRSVVGDAIPVGPDVRVGESQYCACVILIFVEYGVTRLADSELRAPSSRASDRT